MSQFNGIAHALEQHRLGKKMGYAVTPAKMSSVLGPDVPNPTKTNKNDAETRLRQDSTRFGSSGRADLQSLAPNADRNVVNAWYAAAEETGVNGFADGSDTRLSTLFAMQAEQLAEKGSTDLLGKTKESAAAVIKKAIGRLDGMSGEVVNSKVKEYRAEEMSFYKNFLERLGSDF